MTPSKRPSFEIGDQQIAPGTRATVDLPVSTLPDHTPVALSVHVVHGRRPGPVMFVSAAIHGDEVIGVEIVRRLLRAKQINSLAGTLLAVPVVNTFGFLNHSRYLPDRRDLNRCFPGHAEGSLASRLAHLFMTEIVGRADTGIDLHSAAIQRENLPQIRLTPESPRLRELGEVFAAPVMVNSKLRDGSLRMAASEQGCDVLLYEAGEGLRFDENAAIVGVSGILRVMRHMGMIGARGVPRARAKSLSSDRSGWLRAPCSGLLRTLRATGDVVEEGAVLGAISDPFGAEETPIHADRAGVIIGRTNLPIVNEGDALFHVAEIARPDTAEARLESLTDSAEAQSLFDEDEII